MLGNHPSRHHYFITSCNNEIMDTPQTVRALSALAHEARLAVFKLLVVAGHEGLPAGVIADRLAIAPSALTFHLKELTHAGLLVQRPEGRRIHYSANFSSMNGLIAYLTENCCGGASCELAEATGAQRC
jgi:ArsR family transcriptional regulator, arsenate/arsenite/antimonite-responsive transcriptional repressor